MCNNPAAQLYITYKSFTKSDFSLILNEIASNPKIEPPFV